MKKKGMKKNYSELDKFDRKQNKHASPKSKSSKYKLSIYDEFEEDEDLTNYSSNLEEFEDEY